MNRFISLLALLAVAVSFNVACSSGSTSEAGMEVQGELPEVEADGLLDAGAETPCTPDCAGKSCGDNGCGGTCGECPEWAPTCQAGACIKTCTADCTDKDCGDDGCGGICGYCGAATVCIKGKCSCMPDCANKECGSDGCEGSCGDCPAGCECTAGHCTGESCGCVPDCENKECGPDGCGDFCGECEDRAQCLDGICGCAPDCEGKECGPDGCGAECGACDDDNVCTDDACATDGMCEYTLNTALCDDSDPCTLDDHCQDGFCWPGALAPECECCTEIGCPTDDDLCDGLVFCNPDSCMCEPDPGSVVKCEDNADPCYATVCQPQDGLCQDVPAPEGTNCDDGVACTTDDECNSDGECAGTSAACDDGDPCNGIESCAADTGGCLPGTPVTCSDNNPCTADACNPQSGCVFSPDDSGTCDDGNICNGAEKCASGACVPGQPLVVDDGIPCTVDTCGPNGPTHTPDHALCDDLDPCTMDECDPAAGCTQMPTENALCDDGNPCTTTDLCLNGACVGSGAPSCDDQNPCTKDSCDPGAGCIHPADNAASCSDGNVCNGLEACADGQCAAGPALSCDDGNPCTDDACDPVTGCSNVADNTNPCADNVICDGIETCVAGQCVNGQPLVCKDDNLCTDDVCDPVTGCKYPADDANSCSDANACNGPEKCVAGACVPGSVLNCNDGKECTSDSCHPNLGCVNSPVQNGTTCSIGGQYSCKNGECVCTPACTGKKCGNDGCGGSCGTCKANEKCLDFQCVDEYTCVDMLACGIKCGYTMQCILSCYGAGGAKSQALFQSYGFCLVQKCGLTIDPVCVMMATAGDCSDEYAACVAD